MNSLLFNWKFLSLTNESSVNTFSCTKCQRAVAPRVWYVVLVVWMGTNLYSHFLLPNLLCQTFLEMRTLIVELRRKGEDEREKNSPNYCARVYSAIKWYWFCGEFYDLWKKKRKTNTIFNCGSINMRNWSEISTPSFSVVAWVSDNGVLIYHDGYAVLTKIY